MREAVEEFEQLKQETPQKKKKKKRKLEALNNTGEATDNGPDAIEENLEPPKKKKKKKSKSLNETAEEMSEINGSIAEESESPKKKKIKKKKVKQDELITNLATPHSRFKCLKGIGGWFMGDVGLLANWFILGDGPVLGLLTNKLSKSMFMLPEFFHVAPTLTFLFFISFSELLFVMEDTGCKASAEVGVNNEPENC
ncbi:hypothetical protein NQ317_013797 [Molorchus minor]|uniref:Uncharacterized protein n=1 Tax=Molorchus minor TaxID=1323400 RepID=A0ABQ9J3T2_9CUCU|nr:hypothetical protein NQ317_013797 [Molorchus minor]